MPRAQKSPQDRLTDAILDLPLPEAVALLRMHLRLLEHPALRPMLEAEGRDAVAEGGMAPTAPPARPAAPRAPRSTPTRRRRGRTAPAPVEAAPVETFGETEGDASTVVE